ncbi:hypothetical protein ACH0CG_11005 [Microbacterium sp. 179-I 1D1 NHS]
MTPDTTGDLIGAVAGHLMGAPDEWTSFAMVLTVGGGRLRGTYGHA